MGIRYELFHFKSGGSPRRFILAHKKEALDRGLGVLSLNGEPGLDPDDLPLEVVSELVALRLINVWNMADRYSCYSLDSGPCPGHHESPWAISPRRFSSFDFDWTTT